MLTLLTQDPSALRLKASIQMKRLSHLHCVIFSSHGHLGPRVYTLPAPSAESHQTLHPRALQRAPCTLRRRGAHHSPVAGQRAAVSGIVTLTHGAQSGTGCPGD